MGIRTAASVPQAMNDLVGRGVDFFHVDPWSPPPKSRTVTNDLDLSVEDIGTTGLDHLYADNFLDLKHSIALEANVGGSYDGFSGSISAKYNHSDEVIRKQHLLKISRTISGSYVAARNGAATLKKAFTKEFSDALNKGSADDLFGVFGTHIVSSIKIGGRAEYYCQTSDTQTMTADKFQIAATVKYAAAGGSVEGGTDDSDETKQNVKNVQGSDSLFIQGGDQKLAVQVSPKGGWNAWAISCVDQPGFLSCQNLIPVWELADDKTRQAELRDAYRRKAAKALTTHIISVTSAPAPHNSATVDVPTGYKLLSGGALDSWTGGGNLLTSSFPQGENTSWRATGKDHHAHEDAPITAYAIVTYDPDDIWDVAQTSVKVGPWSSGTFQAPVKDGYLMIGGGAEATWDTAGIYLTASYPDAAGGAWIGKAKDHTDSDTGYFTAYALGLKCKVPGVSLDRSIQMGVSARAAVPTVTASVPAGYVMVGGGALSNWKTAGSLLTASYPRSPTSWEARSKDQDTVELVVLNAYAIGIKVIDSPQH
jgi:hypothetical protein